MFGAVGNADGNCCAGSDGRNRFGVDSILLTVDWNAARSSTLAVARNC